MAHPNSLKNLKPFQPGISGNYQRGRNWLPDELKGIRSLSQTEITKIISKYFRMSREVAERCMGNPDLPQLDHSICSIIKQSIEKGDFARISFLLDRCIGKVAEIVPEDNDREELEKLSLNELLTLVKTNLPEVG